MHEKKHFIHKILTGLLITSLSLPMITNATEVKEQLYTLDKELCLSNGTPDKIVTELNTTPLDKSLSCILDYFNTEYMSIAVSASMDGENLTDLYWSDTPYLLQANDTEYVAVMKADDTQTWTMDSSIIIKIEDVLPLASAIQIDMGASKDGPRDYRIEYSTDEGITWKPFSQTDKTTISVNSPQTIATVFSENIDFIERPYTLKTCHEILPNGVDYVHDFMLHHDIYFKISVDSDYRADGTEGLLGSNQGELALRSIRLYEHASVTEPYPPYDDEIEDPGTPEYNTDKEQTVSDNAIQKEPSDVKTTPTTNQIQPNNNTQQTQSTTTQDSQTSTENATQPKKKVSQKVNVKQTKKTYTSSKLKKKSRSFALKVAVKGNANVTYKKISGSKKLSIHKQTGKITVKKGTKKGTYKMKVKIKVAETKEYQAKNITKTITVKVK